ncbi:MAG: M1 family metallopeptidase [Flavobacterium sp.]|nr:M1 family metallopeptidase [Flavobacterium sp.]
MKKFLFLLLPIISLAQQFEKVNFTKAVAQLSLNPIDKSVLGTVKYDFNVNQSIDSIRIDAVNMGFSNIEINGKEVKFKITEKQLILFEGFKKGNNKLQLRYTAKPKQALYFNWNNINNGQIWTQGQGKYTSNWFPSFDDVNEKLLFEMNISFDANYSVISNGLLNSIPSNVAGLKTWHYKMNKPMSSYLLMLAIGKFQFKLDKSVSGIILENFYQPKDSDKYQFTFKDSKAIFDFLETEIGVKYPWKIYRQIPVEDFLYAGMENTTSTLFLQDFVVDEAGFNDRNYVNVQAHELAHQWFGDLITAKSGKHHWLQEGFATYYALLAERQIFGDDYFYYQLYKNAQLIKQNSKNDTIPILNEKASSISFYQKGAWALHIIRETIGATLFQKVVKNYLKKYQFQNVETNDFLNEVAKVSNFDVVKFQKEWLDDYHFQTLQVDNLLKKNAFIRKLIEIQNFKDKPFSEKEQLYSDILQSNEFYPIKTEIIYQLTSVAFEEKEKLILMAMQTNDVKVRQAVAETRNPIPLTFKTAYETLLNDKSYETNETAFMNLWNNFPEEQSKYLEIAKNWQGNNDKNLRILFLTYFQLSKTIDLNSKQKYFDELVNLSSNNYSSSVRQNAFESLFLLKTKDLNVLKNLVNATTHHKWQLVKYARDKIRELLKNQEIFDKFSTILLDLNTDEQFQLKRLMIK